MHDHKDGFQSCIQCGICTSGCPAARFTEYSPRETARRALEGDESLLTDDSVWYCYYCYTCQSRCPRHNSVAVINQVVRGLQVEMGTGHRHVEMFAQWCANFYDKGMGGNPHLMFPDVSEAWGEKWTAFMDRLLEIREKLGLGDLYPPRTWSPRCRPSWRRPASSGGWPPCAARSRTRRAAEPAGAACAPALVATRARARTHHRIIPLTVTRRRDSPWPTTMLCSRSCAASPASGRR
jgi:heterodisulfide reductase subunit C1